jgi:hypothetical protein
MEKFSKKIREKMEQVFLIAEENGLIRESLEYENSFADKIPYWNDSLSKRKFRLLENDVFQVSDDNFDRWSNSVLTESNLPSTLENFSNLIKELREYKDVPKSNVVLREKKKNKKQVCH